MKSAGNLAEFLRTCSLKRFVVTPYSPARSVSSSTLRPPIKKMRRAMFSTGGTDVVTTRWNARLLTALTL